jgi:hypothetical protein
VQIRGEVGYFVNTYGERYSEQPENVHKHFSHGPLLSVGLGF